MRVGLLVLVLLFLVQFCKKPKSITFAQDKPAHLDTLSSFVPTIEIGNNEGPKVPVIKSLKYLGFSSGTPYCAATGSWCLEITGAKYPKVRTALATRFLRSERVVLARKVLNKRDTAKVGWGIVWRRGNGYHGHFGFVDSTWTGRCGWSIEANTTKNGEEGIFRKKRCIKPSAHFSIVAFIPTKPEGRSQLKESNKGNTSKVCRLSGQSYQNFQDGLQVLLYPYIRQLYRTPNGRLSSLLC
jgi:hypothetical protein